MQYLQAGEFFGDTGHTAFLNGITLTDTVYTHEKVDWHYHENAYFTFILQGFVIEGSKSKTLHCPAGTLLFHNWQEPHYNIKPPGYTRGFHVEIDHSWFRNFSFGIQALEGGLQIRDPRLKLLFHAIYKEAKYNDDVSGSSIQSLLIQLFDSFSDGTNRRSTPEPAWVNKLRELLYAHCCQPLSLEYAAKELAIHPVHLSRDFSKYFSCNFGAYIRKLRIERSLTMILNADLSFSDIAFDCGFADQSHLIRSFKTETGMTPLGYRKYMMQGKGC